MALGVRTATRLWVPVWRLPVVVLPKSERRRRRKCPTPGKAVWSDRGNAVKAQRSARLPLTTYECRCGGWHLTSKPYRRELMRRHYQSARDISRNHGLDLPHVTLDAIARITYRIENPYAGRIRNY